MKTVENTDETTLTVDGSEGTTGKKNTTLKSFLVAPNGVIDVDASCGKFRDFLKAEQKRRTEGHEVIAPMVKAVFSQTPGKPLNIDYLISQVTLQMAANGTPASSAQHTATKKAVSAYIAANKGDRDSGALYRVSTGRSVGGITRWSDVTESA